MDELTQEARQRIYLEEKARLEIRQELQKKKIGLGSGLAFTALGIFALLFVLFIVGSVAETASSAEFDALTPAQKHARTVKIAPNWNVFWAFKTYSELTQEERKLQFSCRFYEKP